MRQDADPGSGIVAQTVEQILNEAGAGRFQRRLLGIFGLVWAYVLHIRRTILGRAAAG